MAGKLVTFLFVTASLIVGASVSFAQKRPKRPPVTKASVNIADVPKATAADPPSQTGPAKKNSRSGSTETVKPAMEKASSYTHFYEFTQPNFAVKSIKIRHDETGKGDIAFIKSGDDEAITDPILLSNTTLEKIRTSLAELDFINSSENYQYERDYSHLGNAKFTLIAGVRSRTTQINYTEVKPAKALMDEYRRIGNQYIWSFDMTVARDNQPLDAPRLMAAFDGYLRRGEISDPPQMLPLLKILSNDERIPLIARNHAEKLIKQIEKQADKSTK